MEKQIEPHSELYKKLCLKNEKYLVFLPLFFFFSVMNE